MAVLGVGEPLDACVMLGRGPDVRGTSDAVRLLPGGQREAVILFRGRRSATSAFPAMLACCRGRRWK